MFSKRPTRKGAAQASRASKDIEFISLSSIERELLEELLAKLEPLCEISNFNLDNIRDLIGSLRETLLKIQFPLAIIKFHQDIPWNILASFCNFVLDPIYTDLFQINLEKLFGRASDFHELHNRLMAIAIRYKKISELQAQLTSNPELQQLYSDVPLTEHDNKPAFGIDTIQEFCKPLLIQELSRNVIAEINGILSIINLKTTSGRLALLACIIRVGEYLKELPDNAAYKPIMALRDTLRHAFNQAQQRDFILASIVATSDAVDAVILTQLHDLTLFLSEVLKPKMETLQSPDPNIAAIRRNSFSSSTDESEAKDMQTLLTALDQTYPRLPAEKSALITQILTPPFPLPRKSEEIEQFINNINRMISRYKVVPKKGQDKNNDFIPLLRIHLREERIETPKKTAKNKVAKWLIPITAFSKILETGIQLSDKTNADLPTLPLKKVAAIRSMCYLIHNILREFGDEINQLDSRTENNIFAFKYRGIHFCFMLLADQLTQILKNDLFERIFNQTEIDQALFESLNSIKKLGDAFAHCSDHLFDLANAYASQFIIALPNIIEKLSAYLENEMSKIDAENLLRAPVRKGAGMFDASQGCQAERRIGRLSSSSDDEGPHSEYRNSSNPYAMLPSSS